MTQNSEARIEAQLVAAWPSAVWCDSHVLVAVSSGADSVALLRAILAVKQQAGGRGRIHAGHFNHGLRGAAADADQSWLERLCARLGVELFVGRSDVAAEAARHGDGWEAAARDARYEFLRRAAEQIGARFVAVAHTADDQAETILHRIVRGTGLAGLAGMPMVRTLSPSVTLVRPLLAVRRSDVLEYLTAIGQVFRTDETNADPRFTRNRLRRDLLPLLRNQFNPEVENALLRLSSQAAEAQRWIAEVAAMLADQSTDFESEDGIRINCDLLAKQPQLAIREVCKAAWARANWPQQAMGFDEWQQLADMALADSAIKVINLPAGIRAERKASDIVLTRGRDFS